MKRRACSVWLMLRLCAALGIAVATPQPAHAQSPLNITPPQPLHASFETDSGDDRYPRVFTDHQGVWLAVWRSKGGTLGNDHDILFSRSTDHGQTWTAPAPLNSNADSDAGNDHTPHLASDGVGNWVAVWESREWPADSDILFSSGLPGRCCVQCAEHAGARRCCALDFIDRSVEQPRVRIVAADHESCDRALFRADNDDRAARC